MNEIEMMEEIVKILKEIKEILIKMERELGNIESKYFRNAG